MEILLMYAWLKIDDLRLALGALAIFFAFAVIVQYIYRADGNAKYVPKKIKTLLVTSTASLMLGLAIPSSAETGVLVATYYGMKVVKSDTMSKLMELATMKANEYIDQEIGKVKKEVK